MAIKKKTKQTEREREERKREREGGGHEQFFLEMNWRFFLPKV